MTRFARLFVTASLSAGGLVAPAAVHGAPDGDGGYVVEPDDYLFGIAHQQDVTLEDLLGANDLTVTDVIHPGRRLTIPPAAARPSAGGGTYTVQSGDSLIGIARRHGVSTTSLLAANGLTLTSVIHPGQRLAIPARANSSTSSPSTPSTTAPPNAAPRPTTSPLPTASPTPASAEAVERIIRDVWPDAVEDTALAIAWRESRYQSDAQSQCCSGLFQLYYDVHKGWLGALGINSRDDLYHPRTNAEAAFALYQRAGGWAPWSRVAD